MTKKKEIARSMKPSPPGGIPIIFGSPPQVKQVVKNGIRINLSVGEIAIESSTASFQEVCDKANELASKLNSSSKPGDWKFGIR